LKNLDQAFSSLDAQRRKGKWAGGMPLLGYDVDANGSKLRVHPEEAERVRTIFALYLEYQAVRPLVQELAQRGWHTKRWRTRKGRDRGGQAFTPSTLRRAKLNAGDVPDHWKESVFDKVWVIRNSVGSGRRCTRQRTVRSHPDHRLPAPPSA
jgi:hypothetical protein